MITLAVNVTWPTFVVVVLLLGFAPGAMLRLIVLAFSRDDPRRQELLAELHAVPRADRPFWVAEQLEIALFEGLRGRIAARRIKNTSRQATHSMVTSNAAATTLVTSAGVLATIEEFDRLGRDVFLRSTGFGRSRRYLLEYDGRLYDSKAVVGYAHGISSGTTLRSSEFSGRAAVRRLESLGFKVRQMSGTA
jgi:hypothetical protein